MDRNSVKEAVREAADIVAVVSQYTALQPAGKRLKGLSPFTNEKTPSFFVDPDAGLYYCFSTQKGGDVFTFVQEMEGLDFKEALAALAERTGIDIRDSARRNERHTHLYHLLESAAAVYRDNLTGAPLEYIRSRGVTEESLATWGIGYAPDAWNTMCSDRTPDIDAHIQSGMCIKKENRVYDRFRNRIMFPFYDVRNRVIGFSGRDCGNSTGAKYINSPESPLFHKSSFLYGLHLAKSHIRKNNFSVLTEGPLDAIMVHQAGYPVAVAVSGTGVTENHIRQLHRLSRRLLIAFDGDQAGIRAALRVIGMAFEIGMDVKVPVMRDGADPASVIARDAGDFKRCVREAPTAISFLLNYIGRKYGDGGDGILRGIREEVLPVIARAKEPLARDYMIRETASFSSLGADAIAEEVNGIIAGRRAAVNRGGYTPSGRTKPTLPQPRKNLADRITDLFAAAARARQFLFLHNITLSEPAGVLINTIGTEYGKLEDYNEGLARMYFEERAADDRERIELAQNELMTALRQLLNDTRKHGVLDRLKHTADDDTAGTPEEGGTGGDASDGAGAGGTGAADDSAAGTPEEGGTGGDAGDARAETAAPDTPGGSAESPGRRHRRRRGCRR